MGRIWLFPLLFKNGCSQSSQFLPQARRIVGSGDKNGVNECARVQNIRDFPQTKLSNEINVPFLLGLYLKVEIVPVQIKAFEQYYRYADILVPRAYDPYGLRQGSRALGATILK